MYSINVNKSISIQLMTFMNYNHSTGLLVKQAKSAPTQWVPQKSSFNLLSYVGFS